jgi:hypothetical protein
MEEESRKQKLSLVISIVQACTLTITLTPPLTTAWSNGGAPDGIGDSVDNHPDGLLPLKQKVFMLIVYSSQKY